MQNQSMEHNVELRDFLRARRARLQPQDVGLTPSVRRRVRGLRRDEVARLAAMSTDYYSRLEQGRRINVSPEILNAVARALLLNKQESKHLFSLALSGRPFTAPEMIEDQVRPELLRLMESLTESPACLLGCGLNVLARNKAFDGAFMELAQVLDRDRNFARMIFLTPFIRAQVSNWEALGRDIVVVLLRQHAHYSGYDKGTLQIIEEISRKCRQFHEWWGEYPLWKPQNYTLRLILSSGNYAELEIQNITVPEDPPQTLLVGSFPPRSSLQASEHRSGKVDRSRVANGCE